MAVRPLEDYVFTPNTTYVGKLGIGKGCLLGTKRRLLLVPLEIDTVKWNDSITTTRYRLGGKAANATIQEILDDPELSLEQLEAFMQDVAQQIDGSVLADLTRMKRLKVKSGWFSRGIYYHPKESGVGGWKGYPLKGKDRANQFVMFYADSPILVKT